jgi:hypothetical protein
MKNTGKTFILAVIAVLSSLILNACGASKATSTPTFDIGMIHTSVAITFAAGLTQTAIAFPTDTPTSTPTITLTSTPTPTTPRTPGTVVAPTASCYSLTGIRDVTIPDNTPMVPGQVFTKTWLVKNTGSCTWENSFKFAFISGDSMGGATLVLDQVVNPGAQIELSVAMTAPNKTGTVRGNWRMSNASGTFFGEVQFVIINLGLANSTATSTVTPTAATPTATATPEPTTSTPTPTETENPSPTDTPGS